MQPDTVAKAMLDGASRGRFLVTPGAEAKKTYWIKRLVPGLAFRIMDSIISKTRSS